MSKPTEIKIAADIIRRVLDAAERGDIDFLNQIKQAMKKRMPELKAPIPKQSEMEYGRFGAKFTENDIVSEIEKFSDTKELGEHLRAKYITRSDIDAVSRALKVPVQKNLDYEAVVERIIEATLGYKMRSQAVRGVITEKK